VGYKQSLNSHANLCKKIAFTDDIAAHHTHFNLFTTMRWT